MIERRYAYVLFSRVTTRQEAALEMLEKAGRLQFQRRSGASGGHYVLIPIHARSRIPLKDEVTSLLRSLACLYIPVASHYFKCHHQYFMPTYQDRKRYGICSQEERVQVGDFFFNLVLILQAEDSAFQFFTCDVVDCVERVSPSWFFLVQLLSNIDADDFLVL